MGVCHSGRSLLWTGDEEQLAVLCSLLQSIHYFRSRPHLSKAARLLSLFSSRLRPCQLLAVDTHIHGALCRCGSFFADPTAESFKVRQDRKSTRLNSSHSQISYAVFCLKKKKKKNYKNKKNTTKIKK